MRVLVLGASGMLGTAMLRTFAQSKGYAAIGAVRSLSPRLEKIAGDASFITGLDAGSSDSLAGVFAAARPDIVINAVGLIKQLAGGNAVTSAVPVNTLLPHRLQTLAEIAGARLVHVSTDCVFSGARGNYLETDKADANDVYGLSKYLGEVTGPNAVTLRTSIIGHELASANGLVEWFLAQKHAIRGFTKAIFSGLPTAELARVVRDFVLPRTELTGLYHVSVDPITKYDLLRLVGEAYDHNIAIEPDASLVIDRSLNSDRFRMATGYTPPSWPDLVEFMKASRIESR
ncbi:SDR family oxidoreductase [Pelagerythrobacter aerophilus]|uniref:dTDP-4-dehydrorhamnose reductase n=1 Tax=Pelagerythrobacter aerophilus TaxID=2306995 RepID=A0A418NFF5_9SPHN|nr:SDR family oxidoreductase [Pelagerythrobacter aerophilus]RIV80801.1 SDR family oxidoreductase [Pelagerythrobacter aerophilus]